MGGGGGYEIENKIEVYALDDPTQNLLKRIVHEEPTGHSVPNYFELANKVPFVYLTLCVGSQCYSCLFVC